MGINSQYYLGGVGGPGGGGGTGFKLGPATNVFRGAGYAAAATARDAYAAANADWLAKYDADGSLAIQLINTTPNPDAVKYQIRAGGAWVDLLGAIKGEDGTTPSDSDIDARIAASSEQIQDIVARFIKAGTNVTVTHDDAANTLTIAASGGGGGGGLTAEQARDTIATFITAGAGITVTHDDAANTLTIAATGGGGGGSTRPVVDVKTSDYAIVPGDEGKIIAYDGSADATFTLPNIQEASSATSAGVSVAGWQVTLVNISNFNVSIARSVGDNLRVAGVQPILTTDASITFTAIEIGDNGEWGSTASTIPRDVSAYLRGDTDATIRGRWGFIRSPAVPTPAGDGSAVNKGYVDSEVAAETSARETADTALGARIDALPSSGGGGKADSLMRIELPAGATSMSFGIRGAGTAPFNTLSARADDNARGELVGTVYAVDYRDIHGRQFVVSGAKASNFNILLADLNQINPAGARDENKSWTFEVVNAISGTARTITFAGGGIADILPGPTPTPGQPAENAVVQQGYKALVSIGAHADSRYQLSLGAFTPASQRSFGSGSGQIAVWAEGDNNSDIPASKIPSNIARDNEVTSAVAAETSAREAADTALGARIDALPSGGGGGSGKRTYVNVANIKSLGLAQAAAARTTGGRTYVGLPRQGPSQSLAYGSLNGSVIRWDTQGPGNSGLYFGELNLITTTEARAAINGTSFVVSNTGNAAIDLVAINDLDTTEVETTTIKAGSSTLFFLFASDTAFRSGQNFKLLTIEYHLQTARTFWLTAAPTSDTGKGGDTAIVSVSATVLEVYRHNGSSPPANPWVRFTRIDTTKEVTADQFNALRADVQQLEYKTADITVTQHDTWANITDATKGAFAMSDFDGTPDSYGVTYTPTGSGQVNVLVSLRLPKGSKLPAFRLVQGGTVLTPTLWSEGRSDAAYDYYSEIGFPQVTAGVEITIQTTTREHHTNVYTRDNLVFNSNEFETSFDPVTGSTRESLTPAFALPDTRANNQVPVWNSKTKQWEAKDQGESGLLHTPRRVDHLPDTLLPNELVALTQTSTQPETQHIFSYTSGTQRYQGTDGGPTEDQSYTAFFTGAGIANVIRSTFPAFGTNRGDIFNFFVLGAIFEFSVESGTIPESWRTQAWVDRVIVFLSETATSVNEGRLQFYLPQISGWPSTYYNLVYLDSSSPYRIFGTATSDNAEEHLESWRENNSNTVRFGIYHKTLGFMQDDGSFDSPTAVDPGLYLGNRSTGAPEGVSFGKEVLPHTTQPSAATFNKLILGRDNRLYETVAIHHDAITDVTWRDFGQTDAAALNSSYTWRGVFDVVSASSYNVNDLIFRASATYAVGFEVVAEWLGAKAFSLVNVPNYYGFAPHENEAERVAKSRGSGAIVFFDGKPQVATVTTTTVPDSYGLQLYERRLANKTRSLNDAGIYQGLYDGANLYDDSVLEGKLGLTVRGKLNRVPELPTKAATNKVYELAVPAATDVAPVSWAEATPTATRIQEVRDDTNVAVGTAFVKVLTASFTPTSTTARILIAVNVNVHIDTGGSTAARTFTIALNRGGNRLRTLRASVTGHSAGRVFNPVSFTYLDTPGATTAQTYEVFVQRAAGTAHSDGCQDRHIVLEELTTSNTSLIAAGGITQSELIEHMKTALTNATDADRYALVAGLRTTPEILYDGDKDLDITSDPRPNPDPARKSITRWNSFTLKRDLTDADAAKLLIVEIETKDSIDEGEIIVKRILDSDRIPDNKITEAISGKVLTGVEIGIVNGFTTGAYQGSVGIAVARPVTGDNKILLAGRVFFRRLQDIDANAGPCKIKLSLRSML